MNIISRVIVFGFAFLALAAFGIAFAIVRSPYVTEQRVIRDQPVPFSHEHHVGDVGLDCRYCHLSVETSAFAGVPSPEVCMGCHSELWRDSPMLAPVRDSVRDGSPLRWTRVHDLPDFVYFHHGIHVQKGVACQTCHGRVDQMPLMFRENTLQMSWCLECHRHPDSHVGPADAVFAMGPDAEGLSESTGRESRVKSKTNCSYCHR